MRNINSVAVTNHPHPPSAQRAKGYGV